MTGIIIIDKFKDWTSHDTVAKLKGVLNERRIGHGGTLDPMATGVLPVFLGRATRAVEFFEGADKKYLVSFRPGITTDTQDITGTVLSKSDKKVSKEELEECLKSFIGPISQIPPMYSAIKKDGKKLYELARAGKEIEREPRNIVIRSIDILGQNGSDFTLSVECSKGTYVRTLCNDIGEKLGCGGTMSSLRRIRAGRFSIMDAHPINMVETAVSLGTLQEIILPVDCLFEEYGKVTVNAAQEQLCRNGNPVPMDGEGRVRVYSESGEFLLLGQFEEGKLKTVKSFFEVEE